MWAQNTSQARDPPWELIDAHILWDECSNVLINLELPSATFHFTQESYLIMMPTKRETDEDNILIDHLDPSKNI